MLWGRSLKQKRTRYNRLGRWGMDWGRKKMRNNIESNSWWGGDGMGGRCSQYHERQGRIADFEGFVELLMIYLNLLLFHATNKYSNTDKYKWEHLSAQLTLLLCFGEILVKVKVKIYMRFGKRLQLLLTHWQKRFSPKRSEVWPNILCWKRRGLEDRWWGGGQAARGAGSMLRSCSWRWTNILPFILNSVIL